MSAISGKPGAELDALPSEQYDQLASTAALFPDGMEESELGEIPRGWTVPRVSNVLELVYGKALKSTDRLEGTVPVYGSGGVTGYHNAPLVPHGSIIVGRKGTVGSLYWEDEPFFPIDTTYYVRPLAAPLTFCYYAMQTLGLEKMNTDAAVPGLNRENVYRLELVLPDLDALQKFDVEVLALRKAMSANSNSNKALANLRNTLLPKLLSGELPVEKVLMEADK
ncbi:Type I restriction modification DNA specificity domain protein [compost metagenome]